MVEVVGMAGAGGGSGIDRRNVADDQFVEKLASAQIGARGAGEGYSSGHGGSGFVRCEAVSCAGM